MLVFLPTVCMYCTCTSIGECTHYCRFKFCEVTLFIVAIYSHVLLHLLAEDASALSHLLL